MKSKLGIICIILGVALMLGAVFLYQSNRAEDQVAQEAVVDVMPQLVEQIREHTVQEETVPESEVIPELELQIPVELLTEEDKKMTEVEISGNRYIG